MRNECQAVPTAGGHAVKAAKELSQPLANRAPDLTAPQANQIGIWPRTMGDN